MYRVSVDNQFPYRVYGSAQDNWEVLSVPSRSGHYGMRLQLQHWDGVGGMEGGVAVIRPDNPDIVYAGSTSGAITRYDRSTGQIRPIKAYPEVGGLPAKHLRYRFQRTAPIVLSPHDPNVLYHASHVVHRSMNEGQSWEVISPDLTTGDPERINTWGGPITREVTSEEVYCTIFALAESKHLPGVLWAGTDDGLVHLSRDAGENWKNITPADMPDSGTVNILEVSPHAAGRAFISVLRYRLDDFRPYVFRTDDFGESWELLTDGTNGIPADQFVRVVREDPDRKGLLYAGTEYGVFVSFDDGAHWQSLQLNFPVAPVTDLVVHEKDLVLSTKGRSFWILDDLSPLHQLTDEVAASSAHLFAPRAIHRVRTAEEEAVDEYVGGWRSVANPRDLYGGARITRDPPGHGLPERRHDLHLVRGGSRRQSDPRDPRRRGGSRPPLLQSGRSAGSFGDRAAGGALLQGSEHLLPGRAEPFRLGCEARLGVRRLAARAARGAGRLSGARFDGRLERNPAH